MRSIIIFSLLAILSPIQGRMLSQEFIDDGLEHRYDVKYDGTFRMINALAYKHIRADFPVFGNKCSAYVNGGGINVNSPYMEGMARLTIVGSNTPQERDDLKSRLCALMKSGDRHPIAFTEISASWAVVILYDGIDAGRVAIEGFGPTLISDGGGRIRFENCSC